MDGNVADARFYAPQGVAVDTIGNVYVADRGNKTIRKITPSGNVTTLAGTAGVAGNDDGTGPAARFKDPYDVAVDGAGNVYVAEATFRSVYSGAYSIRRITPTGVVTTLSSRTLNSNGIAADSAGNVYISIADGTGRFQTTGNNILKITPTGVESTLAGTAEVCGSGDGRALFCNPSAIAADGAGNVYVANDLIRKITPDGVVTTLVHTPLRGTSSYVELTGIAVDGANNIYVATANAVQKVTHDGIVTVFAGNLSASGNADGEGAAARFTDIAGLSTDNAGNVYVAESGNNTIRKITPNAVVTTLAGTAGLNGSADGTGAAARFGRPFYYHRYYDEPIDYLSYYNEPLFDSSEYHVGMATDSAGNLYVVDASNFTVRKIMPGGVVTTLAGSVGQFGTLDGTGPTALFHSPRGVAADSVSNLYVVDNHTIRKITPDGVVTTLAGSHYWAAADDGVGIDARFNRPTDIAADSAGNLYVTDSENHTIRKITPAGIVTTIAGSAGAPGNADGAGAAARFFLPKGLGIDSGGNLYVFDSGNYTIRKITPNAVVTTLAGTAGLNGSADGTGAAARFGGGRARGPTFGSPASGGIATDSTGNVYVADAYNSTVRKVTPDGVVTTVVGMPRVRGFVPGELPGVVSNPYGIAISGGALYITTNQGVAVVWDLVRNAR